MVRGHAKEVAQAKNAAKQKAEKGSQLGQEKKLTTVCPECKAQMASYAVLKQHFEAKHPKKNAHLRINANEARSRFDGAQATEGVALTPTSRRPRPRASERRPARLAIPTARSEAAMPLRKEARPSRVCSSPCHNRRRELFHRRLSCLAMFPPPASLTVRASSPAEHLLRARVSHLVSRVRLAVQ
eukprot:CAMPEP_0181249864 /NCGR_PEP_ID=MMETSP1096-20121128/46000_1 /TAXON_ID=156174 ORGANISM="Chrysochromulina ericina, Strain CCMP281" /NCGR_SAMPLE_ID=MMETSP1096 /ASSEMBLY_ACC=CAM_ASM_000453 /LENGTH=184 /DNA_ID=CAMNT_0023347267 /DNA_START=27 /DNA_END=582 /DNA_ORIENTATION=-